MANEKWRIRSGSRRLEIDGTEVAGMTAAKMNALAAADISGAEFGFIDGVTAGTAAASKALVLDANLGISNFRHKGATYLYNQAVPAAKTTTTTLTAAELLTGLITGNQGAAGTATYTLPTGTLMETALVALFPGLQNDDSFDFTIINISTVAAEDITVAAGASFTIVGKTLIESNEATGNHASQGTFRCRRTAANTYVAYRIA